MATENRLAGLDALRGIAALTVLGFHIHTVFGGFELFGRSYLAVDFFFMLSGYVMARTYEGRFASGLTMSDFIQARYRRLFLPMAIGAVIGFTFFASQGEILWIPFVTTLVFIPLAGVDPFILNRPAWSIFFEIFANVIHAAVLWKLRLRMLALLALAATVCLYFYARGYGDDILVGNKGGTLLGGFVRVIITYTIGIILCRWGRVLATPSWLSYAALVGLLLLIPVGMNWDMAFILIACPLLIVCGAKSDANRVAAWFGTISFPLYAVHYPILQVANYYGCGPMSGAFISLAFAALVAKYADRLSSRLRPALAMS